MNITWKLRGFLVLAAITATVFAGFVRPAQASAVNPSTINFQGKVVNANGTNVTDGVYPFTFKIYSVNSGGTAVWGETQSSVNVISGVFQVNLGSTCSMFVTQTCSGFTNTAIDFSASNNLYLGITFNNDAAGEMSPRPQLQSVPFAFNADTANKLGGLSAGQFVQLSPGSQQLGFISVNGAGTFGGAVTTATLQVQPSTDSTTALQVLRSTANSSTSVLAVDTTTNNTTLTAAYDSRALGTELFTGSVVTTAGWSTNGSSGQAATATHTASGGTTTISMNPALVPASGQTYFVSFTMTGRTTGSLLVTLGGSSNSGITGSTTTVINTGSTGAFSMTPTTDFNGTISNISVRQLTGTAPASLTVANPDGTAAFEVRNGGSGRNNTFVGLQAARNNTTGNSNTIYGASAFLSNTSGNNNTATGLSALQNNGTGSSNTSSGGLSLQNNTSGNNNAAFGYNTMVSNTTGSFNTSIGSNASNYDPTITTITTLNNLSNATTIGYGAQVQASNSLILGGQGVNQVNVGMGTTVPTNFLSVSPYQDDGNGAAKSAGTGGVSSTTVTGVGTAWLTTASVGSEIIFGNVNVSTAPLKAVITAINSDTSLTVTPAVTVGANKPYRINRPALQVTTTGKVGVGTASPAAGLDVQTAVTAAGNVANGARLQQTLSASANNDVLSALQISPTFVNGAFTGVTNNALTVRKAGESFDRLQVTANGGFNFGAGTGTPATSLSLGASGLETNSGFSVLTGNLNLGVAGTSTGVLALANATGSNTVNVQSVASSSAYNLFLATSGATGNQCLQSTSGSTTASTALQWGSCSTGAGVTAVSAIDTAANTGNGIAVNGSNIYLQSANANYGGIVTNTIQTFAGNKTFNGLLSVNNDIQFTSGATRKLSVAAATSGTVGYDLSLAAGAAFSGTGGAVSINGGAAAGTNQNGGNISLDGGIASGTGHKGYIVLQSNGGNVGIDNVAPDYKLTLNVIGQTADGIRSLAADGHTTWQMPSALSGAFNSMVGAGDAAYIFSNGTKDTGAFVLAPWTDQSGTGLRMNSEGSVGIGTVNPTATLHVVGRSPAAVATNGTDATGALSVLGAKGGGTTGTTAQVAGAGADISLTSGDGGNAAAGSTNGNGGTIFLQGGAAGSGTGTSGFRGNVVLQGTGGTVGIGTITPDILYKLDVGGAAKIQGALAVASAITFLGASANSITGASGQNLTIQSQGTGQLNLATGSTGILGLDSSVTTLQRTTAGTTTIDLANASNTLLELKNSNSGVANLNLFGGSLQTGSTPTTRLDNTGNLVNIGNYTSTGSITGGTVISNQTDTVGTTYPIAVAKTGYYLSATSATQNSAITSTFNITGLPATDGTMAAITAVSAKGVTSAARIHTTIVQISGTTVATLATTSIATAATTQRSFIVMRLNAVWQVIGEGPTAAPTGSTVNTADFAEWIHYSGDSQPQPGDVIRVGDEAGSVTRTRTAYDESSLGVVSTTPYDVGSTDDGHSVIIALSGRVPVTVNLENGPIAIGDRLTPSSVPGVAMKATRAGRVIGTALSAYDGTQEAHQVTVQLGVGYDVPPVSTQSILSDSLTTDGALVLDSGNSDDIAIDSSANSAYVNIAPKAEKVTISGPNQTTTIAGALIIDQAATFHGTVNIDAKSGEGILTTENLSINSAGDIATNGSVVAKGGSLQLFDASGASLFTIDNAGNGVMAGSLNLASASISGGLTVGGDIKVVGLSTFERLATFMAKTVFRQDVEFDGHITVAADSAGYAMLRSGESYVHVAFKNAYENAPVVYVSAADGQFVQVTASKITADGFDIVVEKPLTKAAKFSWTATGVKDAQTAENPLPVSAL